MEESCQLIQLKALAWAKFVSVEEVGIVVNRWAGIYEVLGSSLGRNKSCHDREFFMVLLSSIPGRVNPQYFTSSEAECLFVAEKNLDYFTSVDNGLFLSRQVAWIHIDRQMILTIHRHVIARVPRFSVSHDNQKTWLLHVSGVHQEDRGYYMCQVNTNPMISQVGYLQVVEQARTGTVINSPPKLLLAPSSYIQFLLLNPRCSCDLYAQKLKLPASIHHSQLMPPNILDGNSTQSSVAIRENQNITLTCKADGFPTPKLMWRREDGQGINIERRKKGE
ncbi:hypothetical protein B7P43_G15750 [Cryptotermes secundus]|uniref:Ig-like domain-containing protein n=1 Tax=Cryptotermes secundus TaxID=105785 RepID=A0A2J7QWZ2_9NEOP|nr:hypothetical protein B7P43_G15750 [Cryptotermes secundus]